MMYRYKTTKDRKPNQTEKGKENEKVQSNNPRRIKNNVH